MKKILFFSFSLLVSVSLLSSELLQKSSSNERLSLVFTDSEADLQQYEEFSDYDDLEYSDDSLSPDAQQKDVQGSQKQVVLHVQPEGQQALQVTSQLEQQENIQVQAPLLVQEEAHKQLIDFGKNIQKLIQLVAALKQQNKKLKIRFDKLIGDSSINKQQADVEIEKLKSQIKAVNGSIEYLGQELRKKSEHFANFKKKLSKYCMSIKNKCFSLSNFFTCCKQCNWWSKEKDPYEVV